MRPFILDSRGTFWIALGFLPLLPIHDMAVLDRFVLTLLRVLLTCYCLRYLTPLSLDEMNDSCASDQLLYLVSHSVCLGHISSVRPCLCYYYKQATEMNTNGTKTRKWVRQRRDNLMYQKLAKQDTEASANRFSARSLSSVRSVAVTTNFKSSVILIEHMNGTR